MAHAGGPALDKSYFKNSVAKARLPGTRPGATPGATPRARPFIRMEGRTCNRSQHRRARWGRASIRVTWPTVARAGREGDVELHRWE